MVAAVRTHMAHGEASRIGPALILLLLAVFVAVERFGPRSL